MSTEQKDSAHATLVGKVGTDPECRTTASGKQLARCRLAVSTGKEETSWFTVVGWEAMAEHLMRVAKGERVTVQGRLRIRPWTGRDGQQRLDVELSADAIESLDSATRQAQASFAEEFDDVPF